MEQQPDGEKMRLTFDEYNDLEEKLLGIDDEVYIPTKQELQMAESAMEQYGLYFLWVSLKETHPKNEDEHEVLKEIKKAVNHWIILIDEEDVDSEILSLTEQEFDTLTDVLLKKIPFQPSSFIPTKEQMSEMESDLDHYGLFLLWLAEQEQLPEDEEEKKSLDEIDRILDRLIEITDSEVDL